MRNYYMIERAVVHMIVKRRLLCSTSRSPGAALESKAFARTWQDITAYASDGQISTSCYR